MEAHGERSESADGRSRRPRRRRLALTASACGQARGDRRPLTQCDECQPLTAGLRPRLGAHPPAPAEGLLLERSGSALASLVPRARRGRRRHRATVSAAPAPAAIRISRP